MPTRIQTKSRSHRRRLATPFEGILDQVSGSLSAWSVRVLRTAMIGQPIIRLRENSGNTEQDFWILSTDDHGIGVLLNAVGQTPTEWKVAEGASTLFVVTWYDQISTRHATIATAGAQPAFDGANTWVQPTGNRYLTLAGGVWTPSPFTAYLLVYDLDAANGSVWVGVESLAHVTDNYMYRAGTLGTPGTVRIVDDNSTAADYASGILSNTWYLQHHTHKAHPSGELRSGANGTWGSPVTPSAGGSIRIVDLFGYDSAFDTFDADGYCREIVFFNSLMNDTANEDTYRTSINNAWSLSI